MKDSSLQIYLTRLGLDESVAEIYKSLVSYGDQTISQLARNSGVPRTRIYRLLDELTSSGLVEIDTRFKRSLLKAGSFSRLEVILAKKEQELKDLQTDHQALASQLKIPQTIQTGPSRVNFYEGIDGIKQMLWLETKGKGENLSILRDGMKQQTGLSFFLRWSERCEANGIKFRSVIGDNFQKTQSQWYSKYHNKKLANWRGRYLPTSVLDIEYSITVFDDTVLHYNWESSHKIGIAIHDKAIASMQRNIFEILWGIAKDD